MSYATDLLRHDRKFDVVIADDSTEDSQRTNSQEWLAAFARKFRLEVFYIGYEERCQFVDRLANIGIPPEIIRLALTNTLKIPASPGANRNALLLHTFGDLLLSCDDDSVCHVGDLRHGDQSVRLAPFGNACMDVHFMASRRAAISGVRRDPRDIMTAHEQLLGRKVHELGARNSDGIYTSGKVIDVFVTNPADGHVGITLSGGLGDPGVPNLMNFIFSRGQVRKRFLDYWKSVIVPTSLNIISGVPFPVISPVASIMMTTATGLDNRLLFPPFLSSGRGEDSLMGSVARKNFHNLHTGFIPAGVLHARQKSSVSEPICAPPRLSDLLILVVESCPDQDVSTIQERLKRVGSHLIEFGEYSLADFKSYLKEIALRRIDVLTKKCENFLREFHSEPECWSFAIRQGLALLQQQYLNRDLGMLGDFPLGAYDSSYKSLQEFIGNFGKLLRTWPDIIAATIFLRESGFSIGRRL